MKKSDFYNLGLFQAIGLYAAAGGNSLRFLERIAEYGDVIHLEILGRHNYLITHPELIEKVLMSGYRVGRSRPQPLRKALGKGLICSQGVFHQRMRHRIQPFFHKQMVEGMGNMMVEYAQQSMASWQEGDTKDMEKEMIHLTLGIILKALFGTDFGSEIETVGQMSAVIHRNGNATPKAILNTVVERIPFLGKRTRLAHARNYMNDLIFGLMEKRRADKDFEKQDLLSKLLSLQQTEEAQAELTDEQIRDEILTMLTAGHETIASALTWVWYFLSQSPEVEKKLQQELKSVLAGRIPGVADIPGLQYTKKIFSEAMRIYPPVWSSARRPFEDLNFGSQFFPMGSCIYITQYLVHRDTRFWKDPEKFDPERFSPEENAKRPKFAYFPFGGGNRQCIGEGFAWTEAILLIALIAQKWQFRLSEGQRIALDPLIALQPKYGMRMHWIGRKPNLKPDKLPLKNSNAASISK